MDYRNARFLADGRVDCEIEHPSLGWIPFTLNPEEKSALFDVKEIYDRIVEEGEALPYSPPSPDVVQARMAEVLAADSADLLAKSDIVVLRCYEAGKPIPEAWVSYREMLRQVVRGDASAVKAGIPDRPDYPV